MDSFRHGNEMLFFRRGVVMFLIVLLGLLLSASDGLAAPAIDFNGADLTVSSDAVAADLSVDGQKPQSSRPKELRLIGAHSFTGDLRRLPQTKPVITELPRRPDPIIPLRTYGTKSLNSKTLDNPIDSLALVSAPLAPAPSPSASFEGLDFANWGAGHPADPNGDVGPEYYIQVINSSIGIFDKSDGTRVSAVNFNTLMSQGNFGNLCDTDNFGDPIVLYDTFEDRWIISDFAFTRDGSGNVINPPGSFQCFAVSKTGDPVSGGWNFYSIGVSGGFNDYPKFGIWPDGLYMSANMFGYAAGGSYRARVWAFNKAQMYAGSPTVQIVTFDAPSTEFTLLPSNARLQAGTPPAGRPNYFASVWNYLNAVSVYQFHVDWEHVSLSTFTGPFDTLTSTWWAQYSNAGVTTAPSPANRLDTLYPRLMMQNQYTNINGIESLWASQTAGAGNPTTNLLSAQAAVRYYQVKVTGGTVESTATQAYTYSPDATVFRFMPSVAVDRVGDMAIGYTATNATLNPAIRYAGRLTGDPVNSITQTEQSLIEGTGTQSGNCGASSCVRWGDYTAMTLDPDGCTFWYTNMYYQTTGLNFNTRIGSFSLSGCTPVGSGGTLEGTVKRAGAGTPISGATIQFGSRTTTTNASGFYQFTTIPAGTYPGLGAVYAGYTDGVVNNIIVTDSATTTQDFVLSAAAASGCFTDTTQAHFQAGVATNCDLTGSPGDVTLLNSPTIESYNGGTTTGTNFSVGSWGGQTFIPSASGPLTKVDINLFCLGCTGTTPNLTVSIRATSAGLPTGPDLATATIPGFSSGAAVWYTANFGTSTTVTGGTQYALIVRPEANPSLGGYYWLRASPGGYANGQRVSSTTVGASWTADSTRDFNFKAYVDSGYSLSGNLVSGLKDANPALGETATWKTLAWTASTPASTALQFQVAGSNSAAGPFNFVGPDGSASTYFTTSGASLAPQFNGFRYLKYKAVLDTSDSTATPALNDATICFTTDNTPPDTTITITPSDPGNSSSASFSFTGSNPGGSGVASFECDLDGGGFSACTSPKNYTSLVDGSHTFQVRAIDNAGNTDLTPASFTWVVDTIAPNTSITDTPSNPTASASAVFTFTGSDPGGSGVASFECDLDGGGFSACTSPKNYTSLIDGSHTFQVRAIDNAGNTDASPAGFTWVVDTTAPDTSILTKPANPTNSTAANFTFSGNDGSGVGGLTFACDLDGGGFSACTSPKNYPGPLADGSHTFQVRASDSLGNTDPTPASYTWTVDTTAPTVVVSSVTTSPTNVSPITVTITFNEPVTGFTPTVAAGDIVISGVGGVDSNPQTVSSTVYTFDLAPSAQGAVTVKVPLGSAFDAATNPNADSNTFSITYDTVSPTVTINQASGQTDPTATSPINFTVVFSESVTGFAAGDVTLSGTAGATTALVTGGPTTYNVAVSGMTGNGTVIASVAAGVAQDGAGNNNTSSTSTDNTVTYISCAYSVTPPTITTDWRAATLDFTVTTQPGCSWSAASNKPWLTTASTGTGSGPGNCSVQANAGPVSLERTGTITVVGQTIAVTQRPQKPAAPKLTSAVAGAKDVVPEWTGNSEAGKKNVVLNWSDNSDNEEGFKIYRRKSTEGSWKEVGTEGAQAESHTDKAATNTTYLYKVSAWNSGGESFSNTVKVTTGSITPPELLTAEALAETSSVLYWRAFNNGEDGYKIWRTKQGQAGWTKVTTPALGLGTTEYTDTTLAENALYRYQVCATTAEGGSACSNTLMINGPSDLTAAPEEEGVLLDWTDNSTDESGFRIFRRESTELEWTKIGSAAAEAETYLDETVDPDTTYIYRVAAYNNIGSKSSDSAKTTTGTLEPPEGLKITVSAAGTRADLSWHDNSTGETGYELWRMRPADTQWKLVKELGPDTNSCSNGLLSVGKLYLYQVCAVTEGGGRACSNMSGINGPTEVTATAAAGEVDLGWLDNSTNEKGFDIWRKTTPASAWWLIGRTGEDINTYQDATVVPGKYRYRICAGGSNICGTSEKVTAP